MSNIVKTLRNRENLRLYNKVNKSFYQFQLNKNTKRIFWELYISKDKSNWIKLNSFVSLKEIVHFCNDLKQEKVI